EGSAPTSTWTTSRQAPSRSGSLAATPGNRLRCRTWDGSLPARIPRGTSSASGRPTLPLPRRAGKPHDRPNGSHRPDRQGKPPGGRRASEKEVLGWAVPEGFRLCGRPAIQRVRLSRTGPTTSAERFAGTPQG